MSNQIEINIPNKLENLNLPAPELITFYKNLENRTLWLDTDVNDCYLEFSRYILQWNQEDINISIEQRKPIRLLFYSHGGDLDVNFSLIDTIKLSKTPIYGYNIGLAESAACFIYMSCHKRYTLPNASLLMLINIKKKYKI